MGTALEYGPLVDDQHEASRIGAELEAMLKTRATGGPRTLQAAIDRVCENELALGASEVGVRAQYRGPGGIVTKRYLGGQTVVSKIGIDDILYVIDEALGDGIQPKTVRNYARAIDKACEAAGVIKPRPRCHQGQSEGPQSGSTGIP